MKKFILGVLLIMIFGFQSSLTLANPQYYTSNGYYAAPSYNNSSYYKPSIDCYYRSYYGVNSQCYSFNTYGQRSYSTGRSIFDVASLLTRHDPRMSVTRGYHPYPFPTQYQYSYGYGYHSYDSGYSSSSYYKAR
jgi:hypothetical protein